MAKRIRSPNYTSISLSDAIERLKKLGDAIYSHPAPRDVVLKSMGYSGANGASLTALAALGKYGLLRRDGDNFRITERGMMYLHPQSTEERSRAIRDAAAEPKLFADLNEQFKGGKASDELIRSFLLRNGFTPAASSSALLAYRETLEFVERVCGDHGADSNESDEESASMEHQKPAESTSIRPEPPTPTGVTTTANPGQFRVSMTDEFLVDVTASRLNRSGVKRLMAWLQANEALVPDEPTHEPEKGDNINMN